MKYIIQVRANEEVRYLQNQSTYKGGIERYWLFEEYKRNATQFDSIKEATKTISELLIDWLWATYTILEVGNIEEEGKRYTPIKEIFISEHK